MIRQVPTRVRQPSRPFSLRSPDGRASRVPHCLWRGRDVGPNHSPELLLSGPEHLDLVRHRPCSWTIGGRLCRRRRLLLFKLGGVAGAKVVELLRHASPFVKQDQNRRRVFSRVDAVLDPRLVHSLPAALIVTHARFRPGHGEPAATRYRSP